MSTIIEQQPYYSTLAVGQDLMFSVSNDTIVASQVQVKFVADVYISSDLPPVLISTSIHKRGTFKTTPNNAGVGMFNFASIVESYVKADNMAAIDSSYKGTTTTDSTTHPIHLIDKYSTNNNIYRYFAVVFSVQYLGGGGDPQLVEVASGTSYSSNTFSIFNAYLKSSDVLRRVGAEFGYNMSTFNLNDDAKKFLTNAPLVQYANINDYGTTGIWMYNTAFSTYSNPTGFRHLRFKYYNSSDVLLDEETMDIGINNGGFVWANRAEAKNKIIYAGIYPGNLQGWSTKFATLVAADTMSYYTVTAQYSTLGVNTDISETYTININCPNLRGYESIRLTWLNQWGTWDYYTFTMKSIRKISTKGSTYTQASGSWNKRFYNIDSYKGGKKAFRVNATETITMNTDFVNESESEWFEELINSPEIYMLKGYIDFDETEYALNQYVTPVRLTTSSYIRKTVANDKLMQYTFEVEKSKTLRTQAV